MKHSCSIVLRYYKYKKKIKNMHTKQRILMRTQAVQQMHSPDFKLLLK